MLTYLKNYRITNLKTDGYKFAFGMYALLTYNLSIAIKSNIQYMLYIKTLYTFATTSYHQEFIKKAFNL